MLKPILFTAMAATLALTMSFADQPKGKLVIPAPKTDPTNGQQMYTSYCAPCHGADARGRGPVAGRSDPAHRSDHVGKSQPRKVP